jgi:hypothetical protein
MHFSFRDLCNNLKRHLRHPWIYTLLLCSLPLGFAQAQENGIEPEAGKTDTAATEEKESAPAQDPLDKRVRRLYQKLESEFAFLLPEGEFDVTLEKKLGYWLADANAHYNFLRGEMGFYVRSFYNRFAILPQVQFRDRLMFVPLFSTDRTWRREQNVNLSASIFIRPLLYTTTNVSVQRFSFPSSVNVRELESQQINGIGQTLGARLDSLDAGGFRHTGNVETEVIRAVRTAGGGARFTQLRLALRGASENGIVRLSGEFSFLSLLGGRGAPAVFLGGRNKLSGFETNEFTGIDMVYFSQFYSFFLKKTPSKAWNNFALGRFNWTLHAEVGQAGADKELRDLSLYHVSVGTGWDGFLTYRGEKAFQFFFYVYKALEHNRTPRYYIGVKI